MQQRESVSYGFAGNTGIGKCILYLVTVLQKMEKEMFFILGDRVQECINRELHVIYLELVLVRMKNIVE